MARVGTGDALRVEVSADNRLRAVSFEKSHRLLPTTPLGAVEYNFRGPSYTFTYVSARDVLRDDEKLEDRMNRKLAGVSKTSVLKDAYVLIGITALGVFDMRSFPFEDSVPGVEGHATLLDNILSDDLLIPGATTTGSYWIVLLILAGGIFFAYAMQRLEAVHAFFLFGVSILAFGYFDFHILFAKQHTNWDTSFFYLELGSLFILTIAAKYLEEQQDKKFIHSAFSKYVAPTIVDSIMKDRSKLKLDGEKKELSILFSDIRGFTTFSESMDVKDLTHFLNDYLGVMTRIVFAHQGTLDKYIGDAVMAFWGAPLDQPDHALKACQAASAMMTALAENRPRWEAQYKVPLAIGIGINSGVVSVGNLGSDQNFEYTAIGDHVNLASRMEGLTKEYGIGVVTSRFTFNAIQAAGLAPPPHRPLDFVKVKGKKTAVELIEVLPAAPNEQGLKHFAAGRELYKAQKWDEAIEQFKLARELLSQGKPDGPSEIFIERCEDFKKTPPPAGWDGSWEMTSK
jgi:adenylate cyclase